MKTSLLKQVRSDQSVSPNIYKSFVPLLRLITIKKVWHEVHDDIALARSWYKVFRMIRIVVNGIIAYDMNLNNVSTNDCFKTYDNSTNK